MESIAELRTICQTTAKKDISNVYMRYVCRSLSIYITKLLIPTAVTPNQVSFAMIVTGVLASVFFLCPSLGTYLVGSLILQFWYILDCVDGELARYRRYKNDKVVTTDKSQLPMTGGYWDYLNHYIVHGLAPLGIAFGLFKASGNSLWILSGYVGSLFQIMLLAIHDTKSRAFVGKVRALGVAHSVSSRAAAPSKEAQPKSHSLPKWIFMILHYSCTFPTVMNVITLGAVLSVMLGKDFRGLVLNYYALISLVVFLGLAAKNLRNQGIDREFETIFEWHPRNAQTVEKDRS